MKKYFSISAFAFLMLCFSVAFSSCKDDKSPLVGTWEYYGSVIGEDADAFIVTISFSSDGNGTSRVDYGSGKWEGASFKWLTEGNILTIIMGVGDSQTSESGRFEIKDNKLYIIYGENGIEVYIRK